MKEIDTHTESANSPKLRHSLWQSARFFFNRLMPALATLVIGVLLLVTIYFTLLDWQWIIFLSGVLFAALVALASRTSRAEWGNRRRALQLARLKERLAEITAAQKTTESAFRVADEKLQLILDSIPTMLLYLDAGAHVRLLNKAFRIWLGKRHVAVDGQTLGRVLPSELYDFVQPDLSKALDGRLNTFERKRTLSQDAGKVLHIHYVPHQDVLGHTVGLFILIDENAEGVEWVAPVVAPAVKAILAQAAAPVPVAVPAAETNPTPALAVADTGGQTIYLRSITEQLTGWDNPEQRLRQALANDEFRLFCQQFRDLKRPESDCPNYEILIRLQEEESNLTPPGAFIPVVEEFNMTTDLDRWVVRNVVAWHGLHRAGSALWQEAMYCLNIFPATIFEAGFVDYLRQLLAESGVPPQVLCFEVAEDDAVLNVEASTRFVNDLRALGCRIALGGFGGGRVSFDILKYLRVHFLKIDGGIVRDIHENPVSRAKLEAIGRVCSVIGVRSIAQFVESADSLKILTNSGIDFAQGFGVARPHSIDLLQ